MRDEQGMSSDEVLQDPTSVGTTQATTEELSLAVQGLLGQFGHVSHWRKERGGKGREGGREGRRGREEREGGGEGESMD